MDPNETLRAMLSEAQDILDGNGDQGERAERLAELVQAMHGWIASGGFLPTKWAKGAK